MKNIMNKVKNSETIDVDIVTKSIVNNTTPNKTSTLENTVDIMYRDDNYQHIRII